MKGWFVDEALDRTHDPAAAGREYHHDRMRSQGTAGRTSRGQTTRRRELRRLLGGGRGRLGRGVMNMAISRNRQGMTMLLSVLGFSIILACVGVSGSFQTSATRRIVEAVRAHRQLDRATSSALEEA